MQFALHIVYLIKEKLKMNLAYQFLIGWMGLDVALATLHERQSVSDMASTDL